MQKTYGLLGPFKIDMRTRKTRPSASASNIKTAPQKPFLKDEKSNLKMGIDKEVLRSLTK